MKTMIDTMKTNTMTADTKKRGLGNEADTMNEGLTSVDEAEEGSDGSQVARIPMKLL
jgi:hypothetical protein